jgi:hypothetical protein
MEGAVMTLALISPALLENEPPEEQAEYWRLRAVSAEEDLKDAEAELGRRQWEAGFIGCMLGMLAIYFLHQHAAWLWGT